MDHPPTVFVIDDEPAVREGLRKLLETQGYHVEVFADAAAFLKDLRPERPGCLILDLVLPGMSGLELQQHLRQQRFPWPIIFISGQGDIATAVETIRHGAVDFFGKPFDEEELLARVHDAWSKGEQRHRQWEQQREHEQRLALLTKREREVLALVVTGLSNKAIAHWLHISTKTVEAHRAKIMLKTQAHNLVELVHMADAWQQGWPVASE